MHGGAAQRNAVCQRQQQQQQQQRQQLLLMPNLDDLGRDRQHSESKCEPGGPPARDGGKGKDSDLCAEGLGREECAAAAQADRGIETVNVVRGSPGAGN